MVVTPCGEEDCFQQDLHGSPAAQRTHTNCLTQDGPHSVSHYCLTQDVPHSVSHYCLTQDVPHSIPHYCFTQDVPHSIPHCYLTQDVPYSIPHATQIDTHHLLPYTTQTPIIYFPALHRHPPSTSLHYTDTHHLLP